MNVHANDQQKLREIFCAVRQQATDHEKSQLLDQLCVGNAPLRKQVEQLLAAASSASPVDRIGAMLSPTALEVDSVPGERPLIDIASHPLIGPYKLLEQIGEGGMGTVFMAVQSQPIKRKVALKIIKPGMDTGQVIARFEVERQALAMMNHPNIAKVLDAGATDTGRPYFVMELVRGIPMTEFCDLHKLDLRQRLEMFNTVCEAVQHAHQKGIIHRDLKPSNILVELQDVTAVPKVIDFGVAKPIHQSLTERTLHTGFAQMIGTPLYMSPEQTQLSSLDVDTRSDVYSLGVLLYEMLTGSTPFDSNTLKQAGFDEMRRIIREDEPQKPSERISTLAVASLSTISEQRKVNPRRLSISRGGELDWIVMKALEKDRSRRYESASAFAQDIQRYLSDEPVLACPPTLAYRFRKYAKRHRRLLATAAMLTTMLIVAAGVSVSYAIQANQASKDAFDARDDANLQKDAAVIAQALSDKRLKQSRVDFDRALKSLDTIVTEVSSAEFAQLPGLDRIRDELLKKALKFYQEIIDEHDNDPVAREKQALAHHKIANIHEGKRDDESALRELNESVGLLEQLIKENPSEMQFQFSLVTPLFSRLHSRLRTPDQRLADAERCVDIVKLCDESGLTNDAAHTALLYYKVAENLPTDSPRARQMVEASIQFSESHGLSPVPPTQIWLGDRANESGDFAAAVKYFQRGIEIYEAMGADPEKRDRYIERWLSAVDTAGLAKIYEKLDQNVEAEAAYRRATDSARQLSSEYPENRLFRDAFRDRVLDLTRFLEHEGRIAEALQALDELIKQTPEVEGIYLAQSALLEKNSQFDLALAAYEKAIELSPLDFRVHNAMALFKNHVMHPAYRDYDQALTHSRKAVELAPRDSASVVQLAEILTSRFSEHQQALVLLAGVLEADPAHGSALMIRSKIHRAMGQPDAALADANNAVKYAPNTWTYLERSRLYFASGETEAGLADLQRAELADPDNPYVFAARANYLMGRGEHMAAIVELNHSIELSPNQSWAIMRRGEAHFRSGNYHEALTDFARSVDLNPSDVSVISWIPAEEIAACSDPKFREGMIKLADRCVELNNQSPASLIERAQLLAELGELERAKQDLDSVVSNEGGEYDQYYEAAQLSLKLDDVESYKASCRTMLKTRTAIDKPIAKHFAAWTCALAPNAVDDYTDAVALGRVAVEAEPTNPQYLNALGAILMRSGMYAEAKPYLEGLVNHAGSEDTSKSHTHYFLALTEHHLGHADAARLQLKTANELADAEVAGSIPWNRRFTIELLRKEAEATLSEADK